MSGPVRCTRIVHICTSTLYCTYLYLYTILYIYVPLRCTLYWTYLYLNTVDCTVHICTSTLYTVLYVSVPVYCTLYCTYLYLYTVHCTEHICTLTLYIVLYISVPLHCTLYCTYLYLYTVHSLQYLRSLQVSTVPFHRCSTIQEWNIGFKLYNWKKKMCKFTSTTGKCYRELSMYFQFSAWNWKFVLTTCSNRTNTKVVMNLKNNIVEFKVR